MKKALSILFLMFTFLGCLKKDAWYKELLPPNMNLEDYTGKEISVFLNDLGMEYRNPIFLMSPPEYLIGGLYFFEGFFIKLYILPIKIDENNPQQLSPRSKEELLNEKISRIIIAPIPPQNEW
jgi:hypothetical protein